MAAPEVRGAEMLELVDAPAIFVANHASHVDTGLLLSVLPRRFRHKTVVAAAADYFFDRRWKAHLWALGLGAIPIERHKVNRRSADTMAAGLLDDGWNLIIFPEGGRSPDGWFQEFHGGAAYLARRTGRPRRPRPHRRHPADPAQGRRPRPPPADPDHLRDPPVAGRGRGRPAFGTRIETAMATMADESRTDWWTARRRAAAGTTPSPRGPTRRLAPILGPRPTPGAGERSKDEGRWAVKSTGSGRRR